MYFWVIFFRRWGFCCCFTIIIHNFLPTCPYSEDLPLFNIRSFSILPASENVFSQNQKCVTPDSRDDYPGFFRNLFCSYILFFNVTPGYVLGFSLLLPQVGLY